MLSVLGAAILLLVSRYLLILGYVSAEPESFPYRREKHLSVPFRNSIFRGIIATERCCFAQLLKGVHSVSNRYFFMPLRLRKAIRFSVNV